MRLGVKAHFSDVDQMAEVARRHDATVLEVHLRPHDVHRDREKVLAAFETYRDEFDLVVHQPERVAPPEGEGQDFFLNPAAAQGPWREITEDNLQEVVRLSRDLGAEALIVHPGGVELPGVLPGGTLESLRATLTNVRGTVPLYLENMPWFYNFRDGRVGTPTLGRHAEGLIAVGDLVDGFCLDVSHAFLGAPNASLLEELARGLARDVKHVHVSGARRFRDHPERGEGVPFAESELSLDAIGAALRLADPGAAVVPEIRGGEAAGGMGFSEALERVKPFLPR